MCWAIQKHTNKEKGFFGYGSKDSFVPPREKTSDMRANYRYIPYLFASNVYKIADSYLECEQIDADVQRQPILSPVSEALSNIWPQNTNFL